MKKSMSLLSKDTGKAISKIIISSNSCLADSSPDKAGVAVYFVWNGEDSVIAVDRYKRLQDNIQAIHHIIEAERVKYRHGGLNVLKATMRAYSGRELPPPKKVLANDPDRWWEVLEVEATANREQVKKSYKKLMQVYHPDKKPKDKDHHQLIQQAWTIYSQEVCR